MAQKLLYRYIGAHTRVYEYLLAVDVTCTRQVSWAPDWLMLLLWLSAESGPSSEGTNRQIAPSPGGLDWRSPIRWGCGWQPREFFWYFFVDFWKKCLGLERQNSWEYRISKKLGVTWPGDPIICPCLLMVCRSTNRLAWMHIYADLLMTLSLHSALLLCKK